jgi:hypothetical protein
MKPGQPGDGDNEPPNQSLKHTIQIIRSMNPQRVLRAWRSRRSARGFSTSHSTKQTLENLKLALSKERQKLAEESSLLNMKFLHWRLRHTRRILVVGGVAGAFAAGMASYYYYGDPQNMERMVAEKALSAFDKALSFESRLEVFHRLPDFSIPPLFFSGDTAAGFSEGEEALLAWANKFQTAVDKIESNNFISIKGRLRTRLLEEAHSLPNINDRIQAIASLLPASLERNFALASQFEQQLEEFGWCEAEALNMIQPQEPATPSLLTTQVLTTAIAFFPGLS